jgi:predicted permease
MWNDLRFAARTLAKSPLFSMGTIGLLAFGLSACIVIFTLADALLLRPLPVREPEGLLRFVSIRPPLPPRGDFRQEEFEAWQEKLSALQELFAWSGIGASITANGVTESARVDFVTANYFSVLGVQPALGTLLTQAEGTAPAVLSYPYWQRRFGGDPSVIGRTLEFEGQKVAIVGVSAKGFNGLTLETSPDIRLPLAWMKTLRPSTRFLYFEFEVAGRLRPGIGNEAARQEAESIWAATWKTLEPSETQLNARLELQPVGRGISRLRGQFGGVLWMLLAGVGLLMLIVCANAAGLLLARGSARRGELAVRAALGATRMQIMRPLFAEALLLTAGAVLAATAMTYAALPLIARALPPVRDLGTTKLSLHLDFTPDFRVAGFAFAVLVATVLLCGLLPAWSVSARSHDLGAAMKTRVAGRQSLIALQVAFCTVLLCGAACLLGTLQRLGGLDPGFDASRVVTFTVDPDMAKYNETQIRALQKRLLDGARALPGVESAAIGTRGLMRGSGLKMTVVRAGESARQEDFMNTSLNAVSPEYFETLGMRWIAGRNFTEREFPDPKSTQPVIVNETFARRLARGGNPLGLKYGSASRGGKPAEPRFEVIGVVGDAKYRSLREPFQPVLYGPLGADRSLILHVRTRMERPEAVIAPVRRMLTDFDPRLSFVEIAALRAEVADSIWPERAAAFLATVFSVAAVLIVTAGLYGLIAFAVTQRRREIGIRMAVGALPSDILRLMLSRALWLSAAGIAAGLICFWAAGPSLATVLYEVSPRDPAMLLTAGVLAFGVTAGATLVPSVRAAGLDPAAVLKQE